MPTMPLASLTTSVLAALMAPALGVAVAVPGGGPAALPAAAGHVAADLQAAQTAAAAQAAAKKAAAKKAAAKKAAAAARSQSASRSTARTAKASTQVTTGAVAGTSRAVTARSGRSSLASKCVARGSSGGLRAWPAKVRTRITAQFGIDDIGGYRSGSGSSDHHRGRALDVMVSGGRGDRVAAWARKNARALNVKYVIWEQGYWRPGMSSPRRMSDRGGATANHYDHVHISFRAGSGRCPR